MARDAAEAPSRRHVAHARATPALRACMALANALASRRGETCGLAPEWRPPYERPPFVPSETRGRKVVSPKGDQRKKFEALEVALQVIALLKPLVAKIRVRDPELADQLKDAATSMALNLAEGSRRQGRDRLQHYRIASGSAEESHVALRVAVAWGCVDMHEVEAVIALLDREGAMTWRLTHPRA